MARLGNKYFNDQEPWRTRKEDPQRCATALYLCAQMLSSLSVILNPFLPFSTEDLWEMLNQDESLSGLDWEQGGELRIRPGHPIGEPKILFSKIEDATIERQIERLHQGTR